jgi:beta-1,4-mannosyltransferase
MTDRPPAPLRVLQLLADPARQGDRPVDNPYTSLLIGSLPAARVHTSYFRWGRILTERFDVLHVHWPENSLRHPRRIARAVKTLLFALFLLRLRLQGKAVVRTVHNVQPHESGTRAERRLLARLESMTTLWIILNEKTATPDAGRTVLVPHGHYRDWYTPSASARQVPGRLLNFGMIRRYKGTEELITSFRGTEAASGLSLHVVGAPPDAATAERLAALADGDPRIRLDLRFVAEQELADEIAEAELVVLPYRAMHNSGAALLALSLDRPVIVPSSEATELLVEEFGTEWVTTYAGELDAAALLRLVERARSAHSGAGAVDLSRREWPALATLLVDAYEKAHRLARSR